MTHLSDIELVGGERLGAELLESRLRRFRRAMRDPARRGADDGCKRRRSRNGAPAQARSRQAIKIEPRRHRLVGDCTVARADRIGLCAPLRDLRGIVWMHSKPGLEGNTAIGWQ